ncbi:DJ-1 family glyoxalase III [Sphaerochaeta halotolerans]|jgi:4-methyl-5(b-hydroxyethyl)-thiazole monophosphate biosynthesis|uniref:DJ-1/PfpI family protein n=1 Tax=Sphaerochaeta halotolerans TaxID=2293840 RepID=A0A372MJ81_9SPIR|nr:DJ-1 family glyoxalase III [Sphaerochaeta halotolerans]MBG0766646.1 DJ-1/PfpI family protein [Spirochaetaceae bacterium]MDK2860539.1 protein deglycase [Sphaerochaeta sp.]MDN5333795.1 protein deglycase [Sphaerochaeta sp.]MXI85573.1 DJ-1 family protein [Sphaerochaeta halotolerans]RFU95230.1 DJ-1/PfpI family protein [Sphaerochaeta halotolerans]
MVPSVLVILAEGFEEVEAVTPIDLLRRSGANVTVASLDTLAVKGSHGIVVKADTTLSACKKKPFDCIVLPGGGQGAKNLAASYEVLEKVIETAQSGVVGAICAAPAVVLGKTGLLDGKRVTGYPGSEADCPGLVLENESFIIDGSLVTGQGPGAAMPFSLALIGVLFDQHTKETIAEQLQYKG